MRFTDITKNPQTHFILNEPGKNVFFLYNRSGELTFELAAEGAGAYIFALFYGKNNDDFSLKIQQHHTALKTISHTLVKSVLNDQASFHYDGLIQIEKDAVGSEASQTDRNLLLSPEAQASSKPELEILTDDVVCHHAATTSRPNMETLWYMQSRGLSLVEAEQLYARGFVEDIFKEVKKLGAFGELAKYHRE